MPSEHFSALSIMTKTSYISSPLCTRPTRWVGFL